MRLYARIFAVLLGCVVALGPGATASFSDTRQTVTDAAGRQHSVPNDIQHIICSGAGCLRLVTYLQAQDRVVGVDDIEARKNKFDARPYALANPNFKKLPVFGGFRGRDNPESIMGLSPFPQVIFKTYCSSGHDPVKLEQKTGIPVICLEFGDLARKRKDFFKALSILGRTLGKEERAKALTAFFDREIADLEQRTQNLSNAEPPTCFVGGIAFKGPHGFASTEPWYPPFQFIHARNIACPGPSGPYLRHTLFSKEKLLALDPDVLFLDLSTLQMGDDQGGLHELKTDPVLRELSAVKAGKVYGVLPYNWYTQNPGSILADAWFMGKTLYPDRFKDVDPAKKADEIYTYLVGVPLFKQMNAAFGNMAFKAVDLSQGK